MSVFIVVALLPRSDFNPAYDRQQMPFHGLPGFAV
jgi:hypothetical protein